MRYINLVILSIVVTLITPLSYGQMRANMVDTRITFSGAIKEVSPAVVNIFTTKTVQQRAIHPFLNDPFFSEFFMGSAPMRRRVEQSLGSGVIVTADGTVVTNYHVIDGAEEIKVQFNDGREISANIINFDKQLDIAVLRLAIPAGETVPFATFGDSESLNVGDIVLAIGNPFGVGQSVSMGIVSAVDRGNTSISAFGNFIQTDAAINPGNSGGALIDSTGKIVGINTAIFTKSGASNGIGFATPANLVQVVVESILTSGGVNRPWLGATGQDVSAALAAQLQLSSPRGVLINEVVTGGPAERAGVQVGDVILKLDNKYVTDTRSFNERIIATPHMLNRSVPLTVWRSGAEKKLNIKFTALPQRNPKDRITLEGSQPLTGYTVEELSPALNQMLGNSINEKGVVIVETPPQGSRYFGVSYKEGDKLLYINGNKINTLEDVEHALNSKRRSQPWQFKIMRNKQVLTTIIQ